MNYEVGLVYHHGVAGTIQRAELRTNARNLAEVVEIVRMYAERNSMYLHDHLCVITLIGTQDAWTLGSAVDVIAEAAKEAVEHRKDLRALKVAGWFAVVAATMLAFASIFAHKGYLPLW